MRTTTTTTKTAMTVLTSGAVALTLLLAGCTGSDDSSSESSDPSSSASESSAAPENADLTGELAVTTCADAGEALGSIIEGLDLQDESTETDGQLQCSWANGAANATGEIDPNAQAIVAVAQKQELDEATITSQSDQIAGQEGVTEVDDARIGDFGGRAFELEAAQEGVTLSGATVITPSGLFALSATGAGDEAPLSPTEALDATLLLLK
jgi:hypothetical protein